MDYRDQPTTNSYIGNATSGYAQTIGPAEPSQIRDGVSLLEERLSNIHDAINGLEKRLETVLSPQPPQVAGNSPAKPTGPPVSHLAGRIEIMNDGLSSAIYRLRDLAKRVEV